MFTAFIINLIVALINVLVLPVHSQLTMFTIADWGTVNECQNRNIQAIGHLHKNINATFIINAGDNFYTHGVISVKDSLWDSILYEPFSKIPSDLILCSCLGDHDWRLNAKAQVDYTYYEKNSRWYMPGYWWYDFIIFDGDLDLESVIKSAGIKSKDVRNKQVFQNQNVYVESTNSEVDSIPNSNSNSYKLNSNVYLGSHGMLFNQNTVNKSPIHDKSIPINGNNVDLSEKVTTYNFTINPIDFHSTSIQSLEPNIENSRVLTNSMQNNLQDATTPMQSNIAQNQYKSNNQPSPTDISNNNKTQFDGEFSKTKSKSKTKSSAKTKTTATFIYLDSWILTRDPFKKTPKNFQTLQLIFLDQVLRAAISHKSDWIIIVQHYSIYSSGFHGSILKTRNILLPFIKKYNVDIIISGHDHHLEFVRPSDHNTLYAVVGGGCCPRRGFPNPIEDSIYRNDICGFGSLTLGHKYATFNLYEDKSLLYSYVHINFKEMRNKLSIPFTQFPDIAPNICVPQPTLRINGWGVLF